MPGLELVMILNSRMVSCSSKGGGDINITSHYLKKQLFILMEEWAISFPDEIQSPKIPVVAYVHTKLPC